MCIRDSLTGIRVVKSFVREDYEEEKFAKRNGDLKESSMRAFGMAVSYTHLDVYKRQKQPSTTGQKCRFRMARCW